MNRKLLKEIRERASKAGPAIRLGFASIMSPDEVHNDVSCRCEPEVNAVPCHYCAEFDALKRSSAIASDIPALCDSLEEAVKLLKWWKGESEDHPCNSYERCWKSCDAYDSGECPTGDFLRKWEEVDGA